MATFYLNQRVKCIAIYPIFSDNFDRGIIGKEGRVVGFWKDFVEVMYDNYIPCRFTPSGCYSMRRDEIVPITDPKADAFIEALNKLKPLHEEPKVKNPEFAYILKGDKSA